MKKFQKRGSRDCHLMSNGMVCFDTYEQQSERRERLVVVDVRDTKASFVDRYVRDQAAV
jgi:hypothetical protein